MDITKKLKRVKKKLVDVVLVIKLKVKRKERKPKRNTYLLWPNTYLKSVTMMLP